MLRAVLLFGLSGMAIPLAVLVPRVALPLVVASEFAQWMTIVIYYVNAVSVRQAIAPDRLRGRVNATMRFLARGAYPIGSLVGGGLGAIDRCPGDARRRRLRSAARVCVAAGRAGAEPASHADERRPRGSADVRVTGSLPPPLGRGPRFPQH